MSVNRIGAVGILLSICGLVGCTSVDRGVAGPSDEVCGTLTYENFADDFLDSYCLRCHSEDLGALSRNFAPLDVNFDTLDLVKDHLTRIGVRAGSAGTMPPSAPFPSDDERAMILNWIECGALTDDEADNLNDNTVSLNRHVGTGDAECDAADANLDGIVDPLDVGCILARFGECP